MSLLQRCYVPFDKNSLWDGMSKTYRTKAFVFQCIFLHKICGCGFGDATSDTEPTLSQHLVPLLDRQKLHITALNLHNFNTEMTDHTCQPVGCFSILPVPHCIFSHPQLFRQVNLK